MNKEIKKYTEMFHYTYEMLALNFGYETRKDTKKFDFDTPNGKLMYATVEKIISPILEENKQLKEQLEKERKARKCAIEYINENSNIYLNIMGNKVGFFINHNDGWTPIELLDILKEVEHE